MTKKEILDLARSRVPARLHKTARIVVHEQRPMLALASAKRPGRPKNFDDAMAAELGVALPPPDTHSADVVFHEKGRLGVRSTVVQIRNGKVARVLQRG